MKKIFVTGGAGYVGAVLVGKLLERNYLVSVLDLFIYGENVLPNHKNLKLIKGDIRDQSLLKSVLSGHDVLIHLACISNDPSFELKPKLGKSINFDAFRPLVEISLSSGIKRFIYASSSSVYGVKEEKNVHEEMKLQPLTDYSRFKAECENILLEYKEKFTTIITRSATVCGYSPRQRFDLVVNILTNFAFNKRIIYIYGGNQLRPNIHIKDIIEAYLVLIRSPKEKVSGKIFNIGFDNQTIENLGVMVRKIIGKDVKLIKKSSNDNRSYHISSRKIKRELGFQPRFTTQDAISDLKKNFEKKLFLDPLKNENYFNVKRMRSIDLK